jgi:thioredoxin reductase
MNISAQEMVDEAQQVNRWLERFEQAMQDGTAAAIAALWAEDDAHWRDSLALTWTIAPHDTPEAVIAGLVAAAGRFSPRNFRISPGRLPPRIAQRHERRVIEAFISFETNVGRASGLLRLLADDPDKAWVLATSLDEIKGSEEPVDKLRPAGSAYSRNFGGENWSDIRARTRSFEDREPTVVIVGAGQAGLAIAARLGLLGVDTLLVDQRERVGDIWRERYHSLALHNQVVLNHLPYLPWPPNWPTYLPKDMIAGWLETYAFAMECNVWGGTSMEGATYDEAVGQWRVNVRRKDGTERVLRPRHLIFANGIAGKPYTPAISGLDHFEGEVMHTQRYQDGARWQGKHVIVIGAGTSGHDLAQDLHGHGAHVTLVQRGSITVASIKAASLVHAVYYEGDLSTEECDLLAAASSYPLLVKSYQAAVAKGKEIDRDLIAGLLARGMKLDWGEDETGHQMKFRRRHGGYYLNCGCSDLIVAGEVGLVQHEDIETYVAEGARLKDGSILPADLIITATGYEPQEAVVRAMLGDAIADRVGPIWGLGENGELNNMFVPTPQPGLWFIGGGFAHARIYSKYIALGIKARELGLV